MSNARNLARLLPNASGQLPDANAVSGSVIQVKSSSSSTTYNTTSSSFQDLGLSIDFTPKRSDSIILLMADPLANLAAEPCGLACRFYNSTDSAQYGNDYMIFRMDFTTYTGGVHSYARGFMQYVVGSWGKTTKTIKLQYRGTDGGSNAAEINTPYPTTQSTRLTIMEIMP